MHTLSTNDTQNAYSKNLREDSTKILLTNKMSLFIAFPKTWLYLYNNEMPIFVN